MNIKNDKYLKLESDYSNSTQTNVSNSIRSPLSSTKHLILNFYEEPSNLNITSSFPVNDSNVFSNSNSHSNLKNSLISQQQVYSKLNSIDQISFKQEGMKNNLFLNDVKDSCLKIINNSNTSINILEEKISQNSFKNHKILLDPDTIPIYSMQLHLKIFNNYILKKKPVIYAEKTDNKKIFGFSAMTFNNNCEEKTKISLNINLGIDKKNSINYFILYSKKLKKDLLNNIISSDFETQNKMINKINDEILLLKNQNNELSIFSNANLFNKTKENYISILSSYNSNDLKIMNNGEIIKCEKNLDFLILMDKGIFKFLYCIEINFIIYNSLKYVILNDLEFNHFLEQSIINIFEQTIMKGGKLEMSMIFVCLEGIKKIFDNKDIKKIDKILNRLEKTSYEIDNKIINYVRNLSSDEINSPQLINHNNFSNITFNKTLSGDVIEKKKKKISFFKCCGL